MTTTAEDRFCSVCARQAGLDPAGNGGTDYRVFIAVELPLPWPRAVFSNPKRVPSEILAVMEHVSAEYQRTHTVAIRMLGIAPDGAYTCPGQRRVICWRRPDQPFARFAREEYLVPEERLGPLVHALALAPEQLERFAECRLPAADVRDLLVCTHGNIDAACSKFGYPIYRQLRALAAHSGGALRAWRVTHFGGHVFAPTLIDLPHGSYWAYVEREEAALLVGMAGDVAHLRGHYRGWAGLPAPFLQVLERELFVAHGWAWLDYPKAGRILALDETSQPDADGEVEPAWAEVELTYRTPDGKGRAVTARIEMVRCVETIYNTGNPETYAYPQYVVAWQREAPLGP